MGEGVAEEGEEEEEAQRGVGVGEGEEVKVEVGGKDPDQLHDPEDQEQPYIANQNIMVKNIL